jgi:hypothetical protein
MKHTGTPLPWFINRDTRRDMEWNISINSLTVPNLTACLMTHDDERDPIENTCPLTEANAAFIVTACNNHEALVESLEAITQRANESGIGEMGLIDTIHAMHGIAKAALARVREGK